MMVTHSFHLVMGLKFLFNIFFSTHIFFRIHCMKDIVLSNG